MNIVKPVSALLFSLIFSIAAEASTQITRMDCNGLSVKISNYRDSEALFRLLPVTSESLGDSALWRSAELGARHDRIRIACALSSGFQGVCSVVYTRDSATTDSCDFVPNYFPLSSELSEQLERVLLVRQGGTYMTQDQVLKLQCASSEYESVDCRIVLKR